MRMGTSLSFKGKKADLDELVVETTRKCNLACGHCLRGLKQDKSMDNRTLANLMEQINSVDRLHITGGEPLLEPSIIQQMADMFKRQVDLNSWVLITNGTVWNSETLMALYQLSKVTGGDISLALNAFGYSNVPTGQIAISASIFHRDARNKAGISKEQFEETKAQIKGDAKALLNASFIPNYVSNGLLNMGRAKSLGGNKIDPYTEPKFRVNRLYDGDMHVNGIVYVDVNGNVVPMNLSYKEQDKHVFGNVNEENLASILHRATADINHTPIKWEVAK